MDKAIERLTAENQQLRIQLHKAFLQIAQIQRLYITQIQMLKEKIESCSTLQLSDQEPSLNQPCFDNSLFEIKTDLNQFFNVNSHLKLRFQQLRCQLSSKTVISNPALDFLAQLEQIVLEDISRLKQENSHSQQRIKFLLAQNGKLKVKCQRLFNICKLDFQQPSQINFLFYQTCLKKEKQEHRKEERFQSVLQSKQ